MCKAPVKSSPPTNQHPAFYRPDAYSSRVVTTHHLHHPLAAIKSRMETFWYRLTHRFNWKMAVKMEREREREREDTTAEVVLQMYDAL